MLKRNQVVEQYKSLYLKSKKAKKSKKSSESSSSLLDKIPRTSLLLSVLQLVREDYPMPFDSNSFHDLSEYVYTKETYEKVTNQSPLFSIDCEMCYNIDGEMEIVWLAMVNERLECVYETFVKPRKKIQNYLTQ